MAIIGGAGNPVGGSFTGPAEALEYVGDHCYAYSGAVSVGAVQNTEYTMLNFTTSGAGYIRAEIQFAPTDAESSNDFKTVIKINDSLVWGELNQETFSRYHDLKMPAVLMIAPYSTVNVAMANVTDSNAINWICALTGRVYRDRPRD